MGVVSPPERRDEREGVLHVPRHHLALLRHRRQVHPLVPLEEGVDVEGDLLLLSCGEGLERAVPGGVRCCFCGEFKVFDEWSD